MKQISPNKADMKPLDAGMLSAIVALRLEGKPTREIAEKFGRTPSCICKLLSPFGLNYPKGWQKGKTRPGSRRPCSDVAIMAKMRASGSTLQQIGNKFGLTRERIRQLLLLKQSRRSVQ